MKMRRRNADNEIVAVVEVDEETGAETVDAEATALLNAPGARRERAYMAEADPFRDRAMSYRLEAEGWRLEGDAAMAAKAEAKAEEALREYVLRKAEIRARISNLRHYLTDAGSYHAEGCPYTSAAGRWLTLEEIAIANPGANRCSRCLPPVLA